MMNKNTKKRKELIKKIDIEKHYDLNEAIDYVLSNFDSVNEILNSNIRKTFSNEYTYENLCLYWYNIFSKLNDIKEVN